MTRVPPFFSIGLTTYDRIELLRQSVSSVLNQTHADFELIIGNDNPDRTLTLDDVGTLDSRVRIINQPRNLGQVGNWRSLLDHATGRYFTWIADDDLYAPDFLAACQTTLEAHGFPACVYSSFDLIAGQDPVDLALRFSGRSSVGSGPDLLWAYLLDEVRLLGNMGFFARDFLVNQTPWDEMECPGIALFREYLFVLLAARLDKVAYMPDSLILYRDHAGSWGSSNVEIEEYHAAGEWLVRQSALMVANAGDAILREQLVMLVFNLALKQIVSKRKNAFFPVNVNELFNAFLGPPQTSAKNPDPPVGTGAARSWERRSFLSLCRQYVAAETGRIEKETEINRIAEEARQRAALIDRLSAETAGRQHLIEQLTQESRKWLRVFADRRQRLEPLGDERNQLPLGLEEENLEVHIQRKALETADSNHRLLVRELEERDGVIRELRKSVDSYRSAFAMGGVDELIARGLAEKDAVIQTLRQAVEGAASDRALLAKGLAEKDALIQDLRHTIEGAEYKHRLLARDLSEKDAALQTQREALEKAAGDHRELDANLEAKEAVVQELSKAVTSYRAAFSVLGFVIRPMNRLVSATRLVTRWPRHVFTPRLGKLNQHPPFELRLPAHYARSVYIAQPPSISIVTPTFKQARFIERTLTSVLDQGYPNLEYYVQDGGSEDGTTAILERYADRLAGWESRADGGQAHAINLGFAKTSGDIMAYLNSDDMLLPGALAFVASFFNKHPEIEVVYGHRILIDEDDQQIGRWILPAHDDEVLSWADYIPQETLFWRRRIWDKVGGRVDESFRFAMDWDLLIRFRGAGAKFHRLPRFLAAFRVHAQQKTLAAMEGIGQQEMARIRRRVLGREVSQAEIDKAVLPYLRRHVAADLSYGIVNRLRNRR